VSKRAESVSGETQFYPGEIIRTIEENLARGRREEAEARNELIRDGVIEPGQELKLPATLTLGMRKRAKAIY